MKSVFTNLQTMFRNNSLGLCQCQKDEWKRIQKGIWNSVMSPYDTKYIDVGINGQVSGSVTVALEEGMVLPSHKKRIRLYYCVLSSFVKTGAYMCVIKNFADFQQWRLIFLVLGLALLWLAPIISSWVPFYYSTSMAIGIFLVVIIILFQVNQVFSLYIWIAFCFIYSIFALVCLTCRLTFFSPNCDLGHEIIANWKKKYLLPYHIWICGEFDLILAFVNLSLSLFMFHVIIILFF